MAENLVRPMIVRGIRPALAESVGNLRDYDRWATLAWIDTSLRYRRTVLGPWWMTLSTGAIITSVGILWGSIFAADLSTYMPFFAAGIILWTLIGETLREGCEVFTRADALIKSVPTALMVYVHRMMARQVIIFGHNAILIVILWAIFPWPLGLTTLLAIPGLIIVMLVLAGGTLLLAILCTRYRDIPQIVSALLQLVFLLTPVMWMPDSIRGKAASVLLDFNPFYYLIEIVRGPLLGRPPEGYVWIVACCFALVSLLAGHAIYGRFKHRVAYWL